MDGLKERLCAVRRHGIMKTVIIPLVKDPISKRLVPDGLKTALTLVAADHIDNILICTDSGKQPRVQAEHAAPICL